MARAPESVDESAKRLGDWVRGQEIGRLRVLAVEPRIDEDAEGNPAIFLDLTLSDPPVGEETWPLDDILELQRRIDDQANELGLTLPWHVTLQKESPEELETDEPDHEQG